jgi:glucokinase
VTAGQSPLARRSTVCIPVEHNEDVSTFVSMISRILHLLVVDMMSVGLAVRRAGASAPGAPALASGQSPAEGQVLPAPGVLISHIA